MTSRTAMEQAFIDDGFVSEVDLELSEALANVHTINAINRELLLITDSHKRKGLEETLKAIPDLPDRTTRTHALETLLVNIETIVAFQYWIWKNNDHKKIRSSTSL